jgi:FG-GAP-like repeat
MKMKSILYLSLVGLWLMGCQQTQEEKEEAIAKKTCGSCHKFPEPNLLDKKTWETGVLPEMSYRLGLGNRFELMTRISEEQYQSAMQLNIYPETPTISPEEWQAIVNYYTRNAPAKPTPQKKKESISLDAFHFKVENYITPNDQIAGVTSIKIHPTKPEVWVGMRTHQTVVLDKNLKAKGHFETRSSNISTQFIGSRTFLTGIGKMYPNDEKLGTMYELQGSKPVTILDSLKRPVDLQVADLNEDGILDYAICEYGFEQGQLIWVDGKTKEKHPLKMQAGARNVVIRDFTGEGKPDLMVLTAQSREGVSLFINKGKGAFIEKPLLQFDAVFGSSYMEVADMNKDGYADIIVSNGDNADYSFSKKAFHGVHLYLNDGRNNFKESYFFPAYGASKAIARDFDQDGDLDLAMIAFFTENDKGKNEGFLYFQNQGNMTFKVSNLGIAEGPHYIVMDAGDVDKDGDLDILLGNYQFGKRKPGEHVPPGLQMHYVKNLLR